MDVQAMETFLSTGTVFHFGIVVEIERIPGVDVTAMGKVSIAEVTVWEGYVQWNESPGMIGNVEWFGPSMARRRACTEAVERWLSKW